MEVEQRARGETANDKRLSFHTIHVWTSVCATLFSLLQLPLTVCSFYTSQISFNSFVLQNTRLSLAKVYVLITLTIS